MTAKLVINPRFHYHPRYKEIYQKVQAALKSFPELNGETIILTSFFPKRNSKHEASDTIAIAISDDKGNSKAISFNVHVIPTYNSISKEKLKIIPSWMRSTQRKKRKYNGGAINDSKIND
ncbi:MAG: hypothetical protein WC346_05190 [Methanogenium sp.]|jgi:hypothetical protein